MRHITREELKNELDNGSELTLIEALPEKYWKEGHLPGSIQIDHTEIEEMAGNHLPDRKAKIVVYCASAECQNSTKAVRTLEALGYEEVYEYVEGKQDWSEAGFPLVPEERN